MGGKRSTYIYVRTDGANTQNILTKLKNIAEEKRNALRLKNLYKNWFSTFESDMELG
jgi:hypothetical protein